MKTTCYPVPKFDGRVDSSVFYSQQNSRNYGANKPRFPWRWLGLSAAIAAGLGAGFGLYVRQNLFAPLSKVESNAQTLPFASHDESFPPKQESIPQKSPTINSDAPAIDTPDATRPIELAPEHSDPAIANDLANEKNSTSRARGLNPKVTPSDLTPRAQTATGGGNLAPGQRSALDQSFSGSASSPVSDSPALPPATSTTIPHTHLQDPISNAPIPPAELEEPTLSSSGTDTATDGLR